MWIQRDISNQVLEAQSSRPAIVLVGARQTGKSSLLRRLFPQADYVSLDRPLAAEEAETNPEIFLSQFKKTVIIDEIQKAPSLFRELKIKIDEDRTSYGKWILTGSQKFEMMKGLSESLAGRIRILELDTLSAKELRQSELDPAQFIFRGGYPELWSQSHLNSTEFYNDYVSTYLERDLRSLLDVGSLSTFERFLRAIALRVGSLLNFSELARDVGISPTTAKTWVNTLEASGIIYILEPYYTNLTKRLVKSPKSYFRDSGLLCFFLGIENEKDYRRSPVQGQVWENFVFSELIRHQALSRKPKSLFFWRDRDSFEVDFLIDRGSEMVLIEAKASENPDLGKLNFEKLRQALPQFTYSKVVACSHLENRPVRIEDINLWNPLTQDFEA
jgi:predicted AAA+ superfamily ATPase